MTGRRYGLVEVRVRLRAGNLVDGRGRAFGHRRTVGGESDVSRGRSTASQWFHWSNPYLALVLYEEVYGLWPVSSVSVGLLCGLTCLLFAVYRAGNTAVMHALHAVERIQCYHSCLELGSDGQHMRMHLLHSTMALALHFQPQPRHAAPLPCMRRMPLPHMTLEEATRSLEALSLPTDPSPELDPAAVVRTVCRGLQHADTPTPNAGLERLYRFATFECRAALTARQGKSSVERFVEYANLYSLLRCPSFSIVGEATIIAGTQTRGALASLAVDVVEPIGFRFPSGHERPPSSEVQPPIRTERYQFTLSQERRPPNAGCWMVHAVLPQRMMFNGDSGAVQG